jgi:nitroreductase / dihydropteridine reductase
MEISLLHTGIKPDILMYALNWRYATKKFNQELNLPEHRFDLLLEVLRLAPSSMGLQPWKFVVVKNKSIRRALKNCSLNQDQITDASHLIILCSLTTLDEDYIEKLFALEQEINGNDQPNLNDF